MWSLSVEEQFYIAIPFLAMLGRRTLIGINIAALIVAYCVIAYYARGFIPTSGFSGQWTNSFVQFQFFAGGMLLALLLRDRRPDWHIAIRGTPRRFLPGPLIYLGRISYGLYMIHIFFFWLVYDKFRPWLAQLAETVGMAGWRDNIGQLIAFAASVCFASLLYRFYEAPFLRLKRRFTFVPSRD